MAKRKLETTYDEVDILSKLDGKIGDVIARLTVLQEQYPDGVIDVGTYNSYGDVFAQATIRFERPKTPVEIELGSWSAKLDRLNRLRTEEKSFRANGLEHPKADEIMALRRELGFYAKGWLQIYGDEVVVVDSSRGLRRRNGEWVVRMGYFNGGLDEMFDKQDAEYVFE